MSPTKGSYYNLPKVMEFIKNIFGKVNGELLLLFIVFAALFVLNLTGKIDQNSVVLFSLFLLGYFILKSLITVYLNFVLQVRNGPFPDNRTANFLTFDMLKFVLILIALGSIVILGLNKVLNNETIATLLGGLVGSLLTMKGSYSDVKIDKETLDELNKTK